MKCGISKFFSPIGVILLALTVVGFHDISATKITMNEMATEQRVDNSKNMTEARDHYGHHQHGYNSGYHLPSKLYENHNKRPKSSYGAPKPQYGPPKSQYSAPKPNYKVTAYSQPAPLYSQPAYSPPSYSPSDYSPSEYSYPSYSSPSYSSPVYNHPHAPSYDPQAYSPPIYPETHVYPQTYSESSYTPQHPEPEYPYKNIKDNEKGGNKGVSNNDNGFANFDDFFKQAQKFKQF